jgi:maltose alpha-D-glucosyltransferase/alpha-amylase
MPQPIVMDISNPQFIEWIEEQALPEWFATQRWFAKQTGDQPLRLQLQELGLSNDGLIMGLVGEYGGHLKASSPYLIAFIFVDQSEIKEVPDHAIVGLIPQEFTQSSIALVEASATVQGRFALMKVATGQTSLEWSIGVVQGRVFEQKNLEKEKPRWENGSRCLGVDQSNTSIVFGDSVILKILRRPGLPGLPNPDAEIPLALSLTTADPLTPPVMGVIQAGDDTSGLMIGTLCRYLDGSITGWEMALEAVTKHVKNAEKDPQGAVDHRIQEQLQRDLSIRTAELHQALAKIPDNEAFKPVPIGADEIQKLGLALRIGAETIFQRLHEWNLKTLPETIQKTIQQVISNKKRYCGAFERLEKFEPEYDGQTVLFAIRHHGDYHLGQVLWASKQGWQVIDFEGEPKRSLEARREKAIGLRDVAGMVRSFDYAQAVAMRQMGASDDQKRLALEWRDQMSFVFTNTYFAMVGELENEIFPLVPESYTLRYQLLDAFILEKNLYELMYELEHRPDWVEVPLGGLISWLE